MKQVRYEMLFSVAELSQLCGVKPTTVRRWRTDGLNGVKLIPHDSEERGEDCDRSGSYLLFTVDTVREFVLRNPRIMTPALRKALEECDAYNGQPIFTPAKEVAYAAESSQLPTDTTSYYYTLLCKREEELLRELEYLRKEKAALEGQN